MLLHVAEVAELLNRNLNWKRKLQMQQLYCGLAIAIALGAPITANGDGTLRVVALTGDPAPGFGIDLDFHFFGSNAQLNDKGQVIFDAYAFNLEMPGTAPRSGTWIDDPQSRLSLIVGEDLAAPDFANGFLVSTISGTHLNNAGQVAVLAYVEGSPSTDNSYVSWLHDPTSPPRYIARVGDPVPGAQGSLVFRDVLSPRVNDAGQVTFNSNFVIPGEVQPVDEGTILVEPDGSSRVLKPRAGEIAPGLEPGVTFQIAAAIDAASISSSGQRIVRGILQGPGVEHYNDTSDWLADDDGSISLIGRAGGPAPGMPTGVLFSPVAFSSSVNRVSLNSQGHVAFSEHVAGPGVTPANDAGIWSNRDGAMSLVTRTGDLVPGLLNTTFTKFEELVLNDSGQIAFGASVNGGPGVGEWYGLWMSDPDGDMRLIQQDDAPAPGITEHFGLSTFAMNSHGQLAVFGFVGGTTGKQGIWVTDLEGELVNVAHTGGTMDIDPGPGINLKTVDDLRFHGPTGNGDGRPSMFNDRGELLFYASFTDGTEGLFVSRLVAVPEPSVSLIAASGLAYALGRRLLRRRGAIGRCRLSTRC